MLACPFFTLHVKESVLGASEQTRFASFLCASGCYSLSMHARSRHGPGAVPEAGISMASEEEGPDESRSQTQGK